MTTRDDKKEVMPEPAYPLSKGIAPNNLYTAEQLESYAAARVAEAKREFSRNFHDFYAEVMRVAPWSESNDMHPVDELMCGIDLLVQDRDELQRRVAELEANDRRYRWLRDSDGDAAWRLLRFSMPAGVSIDAAIDAILAYREGGKA